MGLEGLEKKFLEMIFLLFFLFFMRHCLQPEDLVMHFPLTIKKREREKEIEELHLDKISSPERAEEWQYLICNPILLDSYMQF